MPLHFPACTCRTAYDRRSITLSTLRRRFAHLPAKPQCRSAPRSRGLVDALKGPLTESQRISRHLGCNRWGSLACRPAGGSRPPPPVLRLNRLQIQNPACLPLLTWDPCLGQTMHPSTRFLSPRRIASRPSLQAWAHAWLVWRTAETRTSGGSPSSASTCAGMAAGGASTTEAPAAAPGAAC